MFQCNRGFARQLCCMTGAIQFFPWVKMFFLTQNIFIVVAMEHGCHAKPLFYPSYLEPGRITLSLHTVADLKVREAVKLSLAALPKRHENCLFLHRYQN